MFIQISDFILVFLFMNPLGILKGTVITHFDTNNG